MSENQQWFSVRILRQDRPGEASYWELFRLPREPGLNITGVLQRIAAHPVTVSDEHVAPVAFDASCLEEVCGSCTMLINGHARQACSALVDSLLDEESTEIELRPMSKFPVVRDLVVDRRRLFRALKKVHAWISVDGCHDLGPGPRQSQKEQEEAYPLSQCMSCGCDLPPSDVTSFGERISDDDVFGWQSLVSHGLAKQSLDSQHWCPLSNGHHVGTPA